MTNTLQYHFTTILRLSHSHLNILIFYTWDAIFSINIGRQFFLIFRLQRDCSLVWQPTDKLSWARSVKTNQLKGRVHYIRLGKSLDSGQKGGSFPSPDFKWNPFLAFCRDEYNEPFPWHVIPPPLLHGKNRPDLQNCAIIKWGGIFYDLCRRQFFNVLSTSLYLYVNLNQDSIKRYWVFINSKRMKNEGSIWKNAVVNTMTRFNQHWHWHIHNLW